MTDLIRELEDEAQQDKVRAFVERNWIAFLGALIIGFLGIAGYLWWQGEQERAALRSAATFGNAIQSFRNGDHQTGFDTLQSLHSSGNGYAMLMHFEAANQHFASGDVSQAIESWDNVVENNSYKTQYRELASLFKAMALAGAGDFDAAISAAQEVPTNSLSFGPKSLEIQGLIKWDQGDFSGALSVFESLQQALTVGQYSDVARRVVDEILLARYIEQLKASI